MSKSSKLVMATDRDGDDEDAFLRTEADLKEYPQYYRRVDRQPTLDDYVQYGDSAAEGDNYHELVGAHEALKDMLIEVAGDSATLEVMKRIAEAGGLHKLA